jgi:4a-hydroxytetrahydrobiopterin dehydratase
MAENRQPLADDEITRRLSALNGWERDGDKIRKVFSLDSYLAGIAFASAVGVIAEGMDHHPDMLIGWRKVTVSVNTHSSGNKITPTDFQLAEAIEGLGYPSAS